MHSGSSQWDSHSMCLHYTPECQANVGGRKATGTSTKSIGNIPPLYCQDNLHCCPGISKLNDQTAEVFDENLLTF